MQNPARRRGITLRFGDPDPPEHLVERVGIGEDVMCCLPIAVLIGISKACNAKRRRVSERSAEVGRSRTSADRHL